MASRASLNKVLLIGNLTRDPELRYTPSGAAVCSFSIATNRTYVASDGNKKEEAEFTRIVSWNKLAELCSQLLVKGRKVYVEGRLQTRSWETPDGVTKQQTEVVIDDMRILDSKKSIEESDGYTSGEGDVIGAGKGADKDKGEEEKKEVSKDKEEKSNEEKKESGSNKKKETDEEVGDVDLDDLPF